MFTWGILSGATAFVSGPHTHRTTIGVTETMRIAALASAWKISLNPHTSATGINMVASIAVLAAVDNAGYFDANTGYSLDDSGSPFDPLRISVIFLLSASSRIGNPGGSAFAIRCHSLSCIAVARTWNARSRTLLSSLGALPAF
jgi:hypothetical protein